MNTKNVVIIAVVLVVMFCIFPICAATIVTAIQNMENESLSSLLGFLCVAVPGCSLVALALGGAAWRLQHTFRSRAAGRRLAQALDLQPLNQTTKQMGIWYGGEHQGCRFAVKPVGSTYRYYTAERSRIGVRFYLQIIIEVRLPEAMDVVVARGIKGVSKSPQNFDEAFTYDNADRLSGEAQTAMFDFVQKGYPTGLNGTSFRFNKGTRNLTLRDRASISEGMLPPEVLAGAHVILIHDHPDTTLSAEALQALLDDLADIARVIEKTA